MKALNSKKILALIFILIPIFISSGSDFKLEIMLSNFCSKDFNNKSFEQNLPNGLSQILCTTEKTIGILFCTEPIAEKEVCLPKTLSQNIKFFVSNYKAYTSYLFKAVYKECNVEKMEIPCIVFFKNGRVQLPIHNLKTSNASALEIESIVQRHLSANNKQEEAFECFVPRLSALP